MNKVKDLDLYLLLEVSPEASEKDIRKAYRKKALKCHPDKNPDDPTAAQLFHQLSEALEVLTDAAARKAYDNVLKARKANELRNRQLDEKRKRLKDQLEAREAKANESSYYDQKTEEQKLAAEIERLRKEGRRQLEEEQERVRILLAQEKEAAGSTVNRRPSNPAGPTKIKVRWKATAEWDESVGNFYNVESLRIIFSKYGDVNVVVVAGTSNPRKGSALIEMASRSSADLATKTERGFENNPLKTKLLLDNDGSTITGENGTKAENNPAFPSQPTQNFQDYESLVLRKMRQAEERKRLEQEVLEQDRREEGASEND